MGSCLEPANRRQHEDTVWRKLTYIFWLLDKVLNVFQDSQKCSSAASFSNLSQRELLRHVCCCRAWWWLTWALAHLPLDTVSCVFITPTSACLWVLFVLRYFRNFFVFCCVTMVNKLLSMRSNSGSSTGFGFGWVSSQAAAPQSWGAQEQMEPWLKSAGCINVSRFSACVRGFMFEDKIGQTHGSNESRKLILNLQDFVSGVRRKPVHKMYLKKRQKIEFTSCPAHPADNSVYFYCTHSQ